MKCVNIYRMESPQTVEHSMQIWLSYNFICGMIYGSPFLSRSSFFYLAIIDSWNAVYLFR